MVKRINAHENSGLQEILTQQVQVFKRKRIVYINKKCVLNSAFIGFMLKQLVELLHSLRHLQVFHSVCAYNEIFRFILMTILFFIVRTCLLFDQFDRKVLIQQSFITVLLCLYLLLLVRLFLMKIYTVETVQMN